MITLFTISIIFFAETFSQKIENIVLERGTQYVNIISPGYPNDPMPYDSSVQWNLMVEEGGNIKFVCDDIRMGQNAPWTKECEHVHISLIEDGNEIKVCGPQEGGYLYKSKGSKLTVKIVATEGGSGFVKCSAYNTAEPNPNVIDLSPNGKIKSITTPKLPTPNFDNVWILRSSPNTRISFQCSYSLGQKLNPCYKDILTIDNGEVSTEYCGSEYMVVFSKKNYAKVRIQLNELGDRNVRCFVQAVTGPNANEYENVVSEEIDSSEHGMSKGLKSTTCDCGRANKSPARVTYGNKVKENEFPWMVLLTTYKNSMSYSCGASIITHKHVLTAAHCVIDKEFNKALEPENVLMTLAEHHRHVSSGKEVEVVAEKIYIHEKYIAKRTHDIAIIFTKDYIEFNQFIGPICLSAVELPVINRRIQIMGWGQTEHGRGSNVLLRSKATVIDRTICFMAEWEVCTRQIPSATCFGDSGGPQFWLDPETNRYTQVSLASRAALDCRSSPNTQTDVVYFYQWIQDVIHESDPQEMICEKIK